VPNLEDELGGGGGGQFLGKGFAFVLEALEAQFDEVVTLEKVAKFGKELGGDPGFAELEGRLEKLGAAF
jgi:hypothetical protein